MLVRKIFRTIKLYKAQFISMVIMIAIGVGMFLGFNMEWVSLDVDTRTFLSKTNFADYRIVSEEGFTAGDAEKIKNIEGVERVSRYISIDADVDGTDSALGVTVTENFEVSSFQLMEGEPYDPESTDGMWLFDLYAKEHGISVGDELSLTRDKMKIRGVVKGLVESGEYMVCLREEQLMPDFEKYGFVYISPEFLKAVVGDAARQEMQDAVGTGVPESFTGDIIDRLAEDEADERMKTIYPQINVISSLERKDFFDAADNALDKTLLILTKEEVASYSESRGEVEEGKIMGSILPVLFLLIAVLTMVTTMHRLAANEKTQIGTLKALGFKNRKILWHYTSFALMIGIAGAVLGVAIGYLVARIIVAPDGMMGTYIVMPDWTIILPWWGVAVVVLIVAVLTFIGYLSTRKMLEGTAADALRPYVPKGSRRTVIDRLKVMDKASFGTKWNLRDIMRHKSRSLMTLFGVLGCTLLIAAALGASDSMTSFIDLYYDEVIGYSSKVLLSDETENKTAKKLAKKLNGDTSASISVKIDESPVSLDIYTLNEGTVSFLDEDNQRIELTDEGALVCIRLKDKYGIEIGDEISFSPYGTSDEYSVVVAGFNRSVTESISVTENYAQGLVAGGEPLTEKGIYHINSIYTRLAKDEISDDNISSIQTKEDLMGAMDSFMQIMYTMIIVLVVAAVILAIIVLYNLGIMSFTERYREMATLKVVGFKDRQIGRLLVSQNLWLSVIGVILGIPAGYFILIFLMNMMASEYEMRSVMYPQTIIVSAALTICVSLVVGMIIARKNKKIELVAALKTRE